MTQLDRATVRLRSIASGPSLQSNAISRKSKYRAKAPSMLEGKFPEGSVSYQPPKIKLGDTSKQPVQVTAPPEPSKQYLRPKNLFQGVYFPCMGYILTGGVLAGTDVFPFSPKQEKLHFMHSTMAPMDHLDGEPDNAYLDSILTHMQIKLESWNMPNNPEFLDENSLHFHEVRSQIDRYN